MTHDRTALIHLLASVIVASAILLLVACADSTGPTMPQAGYYSLRTVDGHALPAARVMNGMPLTIIGGFVYLRESAGSFDVGIAFHAEFQDSVLGWVDTDATVSCQGSWLPVSGITSVSLHGTDPLGDVGCIFEVTGRGAELSGRWGGANRDIWGDPDFGFGPRMDAPPGP